MTGDEDEDGPWHDVLAELDKLSCAHVNAVLAECTAGVQAVAEVLHHIGAREAGFNVRVGEEIRQVKIVFV